MQTPKQLNRLAEIIRQETHKESIVFGSLPPLTSVIQMMLAEQAVVIDPCLRISRAGKIEAFQPKGPKAYINRCKTRAIVRILTRCALEGYPIGEMTKTWLLMLFRASDMAREAQDILPLDKRKEGTGWF